MTEKNPDNTIFLPPEEFDRLLEASKKKAALQAEGSSTEESPALVVEKGSPVDDFDEPKTLAPTPEEHNKIIQELLKRQGDKK